MPVMYYIAKFLYWVFYILVGVGFCYVIRWHFGGKEARSKRDKLSLQRAESEQRLEAMRAKTREMEVETARVTQLVESKKKIREDLAAGRADPNEAAKSEFFRDYQPKTEEDLQWVDGVYQSFLDKEDNE